MIYLDYAASTPVDPRVADKMMNYLTLDGVFGNPASTHAAGLAAAQAVDEARQHVADLIGASPKEIVWTSGATESDNLAIKGVVLNAGTQKKHIITAKTEHKAVLDTCAFLAGQGVEVTFLDPDADGAISPKTVQAALRPDTALVSLMYVNNETGVINDIAGIGKITRENGVLLHVDGAQAAGKVAIDVDADNIDLLSLTAHKVYGPKGIGALYVRRKPRVRLQSQMHGGGHERGFRSGTLPTHQIVGMGEAYRLAKEEFSRDHAHIEMMMNRLWDGISHLPAVHINAENANRAPNVLNVRFEGDGRLSLLPALTEKLAVSSGSACISATAEPSYVLTAIGLSAEQALRSVRFSLGRMTCVEEVDAAIAHIVATLS
ncbi:MAG: IscS subfamily cysteine desulfurase [Gammaproteobacteria bacterium]|nr:MAG: IscS subfamily cysteine desulfurase [Gammaproteobacteria bacterium]